MLASITFPLNFSLTKRYVGSDHIHLLVSVPPHLSASKLVQYIKGNTSRKLQMEYNFGDSICGQEATLWQAVEM